MNAFGRAASFIFAQVLLCNVCFAQDQSAPAPESAQTDEFESVLKNPEFHPCATDATYKFIERVQFAAYQSDPSLKELWDAQRDSKKMLNGLKETEEVLNKRAGASKNEESDADVEKLIAENLAKQLPTCYESPPAYFIFHTYQEELEPARVRLYGGSAGAPKLATVPSTEINAYTYPSAQGRDSIVAFNAQLMNFAWQMTKVTLPTLSIENEGKMVKIDHSLGRANQSISQTPALKANFANAILEFLLLLPPKTEALAPSYDPLVVNFASGMEMFAVAHEYGHVIKGHRSSTTTIPLGAAGGGAPGMKVSVYNRSWAQEFEADEVGIHLVADTLSQSKSGWMDGEGWVFEARGALFFFKCLDIIEAATFIRDHGHARPQPTLAQRVALRSIASGIGTDDDRVAAAEWLSDSHPPPWLRLERARLILDQEIKQRAASASALAIADIATGILDNIDIIQDSIADRISVAIGFAKTVRDQNDAGHKLTDADYQRYLLDALRSASPSSLSVDDQMVRPGCVVHYSTWLQTFICSPALQRAIVTYEGPTPSDPELLDAYRLAIQADPALLTGKQREWAKKHLTTSVSESSKGALALLGLSGDITADGILKNFIAQAPPDELRIEAERARSFLSRFGRDTSLATSASAATLSGAPISYLVFPSGIDSKEIERDLHDESSLPGSEGFLRRNSGFDPKETFAPAVFARLVSRSSNAKAMADIADVLTQYGQIDSALSVASYAEQHFGVDADLENIYGNALLKVGRNAAARKHYLASIRAGRTDGWPENNIAETYVNDRQPGEAVVWFKKSLSRKGQKRSPADFADQLNRYAWFLARTSPKNHTRAKEALALSEVANALVKNSDPNYLDTLAECLKINKRPQDAYKASQAAIALVEKESEKYAQFNSRLSEFEAALKKPSEAKAIKGASHEQ